MATTRLPVTFMSLAVTFYKNVCPIACTPFHQNDIYTDLSLCLFRAVPQSYLKCCLPGYSPQVAPNKKHCAFFSIDKLHVADHDLWVHWLPSLQGPEVPEPVPLFAVGAAQPQGNGRCQANIAKCRLSTKEFGGTKQENWNKVYYSKGGLHYTECR